MKNVLLALLALVSGAAGAQGYPNKPVTMVVVFAAGGPSDTIARVLAERMRQPLGQSVIVENTVSAAGTIGVARQVRAAPDRGAQGNGTE